MRADVLLRCIVYSVRFSLYVVVQHAGPAVQPFLCVLLKFYTKKIVIQYRM